MSILSLDDGEETANNNVPVAPNKPKEMEKDASKTKSSDNNVSVASNKPKEVEKDANQTMTSGDQDVTKDCNERIDLTSTDSIPQEKPEIVKVEDSHTVDKLITKAVECENEKPEQIKLITIFSKPEEKPEKAIKVKDSNPEITKEVKSVVDKPKPTKSFSIFSKPTKVKELESSPLKIDTEADTAKDITEPDDGVVIIGEIAARRSNTTALDSIKTDTTKKTSQATLSFGKKGMGVNKPIKSSEADRKDTPKNSKKTKETPASKVTEEEKPDAKIDENPKRKKKTKCGEEKEKRKT
jgi:hypothetical protein